MIPSLPHFRRCTLLLVALASLIVAACGDDGVRLTTEEPAPGAPSTSAPHDAAQAEDDPANELPLVVTTTSILGELVGHIVGGQAHVEVLMAAGVDPHGYQPAVSDAALLREADLVVANGLGLEENLLGTLKAAEADGVVIFRLAEHVNPIEYAEAGHAQEDDHGHDQEDDHDHDHDHDHDDDHEHEHERDRAHQHDGGHVHGPFDPHVWLDPVRMADAVHLIADELAVLGDGDWEARAEAYAEKLREVHSELEAGFSALPNDARRLVTNHDALGYLAERYDFEVIGTVIPGRSTQAEPDARAFAELIETVERAGVPAIFIGNAETAALAAQLASEVAERGRPEIEIVSLYTDALGEPGSGAETYLGLLRENGRRIVEALR